MIKTVVIVVTLLFGCGGEDKAAPLGVKTKDIVVGDTGLVLSAPEGTEFMTDMPGWFSVKGPGGRAQIRKWRFGSPPKNLEDFVKTECAKRTIDVQSGTTKSGAMFASCRGPGSAEVDGKRVEMTKTIVVATAGDKAWGCSFDNWKAEDAKASLELCKTLRPAK